MPATRVLALLVVCAGFAVPSLAQTPPAAPRAPSGPRAPRVEPGTGYRAFVVFDHVSLAASETFDAILGKTSLTAMGAGGEYRFWKGLFVRGAFSTMKATGTRAFVVQGQVVSVGIPLEVEIAPVELAAGWRMPLGRSQRLVVYGGGGLLSVKYREASDFAGSGDDTDSRFSGRHAFAGVDVRVWQRVFAGVEAQYRTVPDALGERGIAKEFSEDDLGGTAIRILVGVRR